MIKKITIIDYGAGNIFNLLNSFKRLNCEVNVASNEKEITKSDRLIIPGVGAFKYGMENLKNQNLIESINLYAKSERPLLGICLGMQYLMNYSEEFGKTEGLKLIDGEVTKFTKNKTTRVPHIGWNHLKHNTDKIFSNLKSNSLFYFCHSYYVNSGDHKNIIAETEYSNINFCSTIKKDNLYGCQFHPERSGKDGEIFLKNFINI